MSRVRALVDSLGPVIPGVAEGDKCTFGPPDISGTARMRIVQSTPEVPAGLVDGINTVYTTAAPYVGGTVRFFHRIALGGAGYSELGPAGVGTAGNDFAETDPAAGTITLGFAPAAGDEIWCRTDTVVA